MSSVVTSVPIAFDDEISLRRRLRGNFMVYRTLLVVVLGMLGTQASAQSRHWSRYEMVTIPQHQNGLTDKVIILDKRSGALWSWSEPSATIMYLGQIFPIAGAGSRARIIQVHPEQE